MNISVQFLYEYKFSFLWDECQGVQLLVVQQLHVWFLKEIAKLFSGEAVSFYIFISNMCMTQFLSILASICQLTIIILAIVIAVLQYFIVSFIISLYPFWLTGRRASHTDLYAHEFIFSCIHSLLYPTYCVHHNYYTFHTKCFPLHRIFPFLCLLLSCWWHLSYSAYFVPFSPLI